MAQMEGVDPTIGASSHQTDSSSAVSCVICNGAKRVSVLRRKNTKVNNQRLETLLSACDDRQDEFTDKLLPLFGNHDMCGLYFHNNCMMKWAKKDI